MTEVDITVTDNDGMSATQSALVPALPHQRKLRWGFNLYDAYQHFRSDAGEFERELQLANTVSPQTILRFSLYMGTFCDPQTGAFYWGNMDDFMRLLAKYSIQACPHNGMVAPFASPTGKNAWVYPNDPLTWYRVISAYLTRYPQVKLWEIGNEVNWGPFTSGAPDVSKYIDRVLVPTANVCHALGVEASTGSLVFPSRTTASEVRPEDWLSAIYLRLGKGALNDHGITGLAVHPYCDTPASVVPMFSRMAALVAQCEANGDHVSLWATEWGTSTGAGTAANQSDTVSEWLIHWRALGAADLSTIFMLRDAWHDVGEGPKAMNYGLYRTDWTPKPAAERYGALTR